MFGKDLISIADLTTQEVLEILHLAMRVKSDPDEYSDYLTGCTMAMIFEKPSLRTRVSFEAGMTQLGGHAIYLGPGDISLGKRESVPDIARTLDRMVDIIMARTFSHQSILTLAEYAEAPVINGLSDLLHPCQALADYLTVVEARDKMLSQTLDENVPAEELLERFKGLTLAFVGDGNNVAHSLMNGGAKLGVSVNVVCPEGYEPNPAIVAAANAAGRKTGAVMRVTHDVREGVGGAHVVYTDVWASMGQEKEAEERKKVFAPYQVNADLMAQAHEEALFLHCLPAHRGEEVTEEVIESDQSAVFDEAENRLHVQKSVILHLLTEELE